MFTKDTFLSDLLKVVPELAPVLEAHVNNNFGEVILYQFMGEVLNCLIGRDKLVIGRVVDFMETAFRDGDEYIRGLIALEFIENMIGYERFNDISKSLGPILTAELHKQSAFYYRDD